MDTDLRWVKYGSPEYQQALALRYRLFYQEHGIPLAAIAADLEQQGDHAVITNVPEHRVLAYARLAQNSLTECQIYQMVVEPEYQGRGLGKRILQDLIDRAITLGATTLILDARVMKMGFYQKFGFEPIGEIFPSVMTGIKHIKMQKKLTN
jgi:hypothetical protein